MRNRFLSFVIPFVLVAAACSKSGTPAQPSTSNAGTTAASTPVAGGATISGRVVAGSVQSVAAGAMKASVDGTGAFSLNGVPTGDVQLQFTGPGNDARLALTNVTSREEIRLSVRVNGSTAELDDNRRLTTDNRVEVEGRVTAINATARTMTIGDTNNILVPAGTPITGNSGATIELSAIIVGDRVEVKGTNTGGTVTASSVKLETERSTTTPTTPTTPTPPATNTVELSGAVLATGRSGACPTLTFMVGTTSIATSAATTYRDGTCASIVAGAVVEVKGTRQANGSVLATSVQIDSDGNENENGGNNGGNNNGGNNELELEGRLTAKTGTCPAVTLTVNGTSVLANASTEFKDVTCTVLAVQTSVKIKATRQPSGMPIATRVEKN